MVTAMGAVDIAVLVLTLCVIAAGLDSAPALQIVQDALGRAGQW